MTVTVVYDYTIINTELEEDRRRENEIIQKKYGGQTLKKSEN